FGFTPAGISIGSAEFSADLDSSGACRSSAVINRVTPGWSSCQPPKAALPFFSGDSAANTPVAAKIAIDNTVALTGFMGHSSVITNLKFNGIGTLAFRSSQHCEIMLWIDIISLNS